MRINGEWKHTRIDQRLSGISVRAERMIGGRYAKLVILVFPAD